MDRPAVMTAIKKQFLSHPIVALLGPRQCGKTTMANMFAHSLENTKIKHFDLENPLHLAQLEEPLLTLEPLEGLVIIDEIQLRANLFPILRLLVDKDTHRCQYLILGSASRDLLQQSSETLAGRISYIEMTPFNLQEAQDINKLWLRGGFPKSYLAISDEQSCDWRKNYIKTYLERDIPNLGIRIPPLTIRRFWMMLLSYHGNIYNANEISRALSISNTAAKNYLDILTGTFMIRQLPPWFENISKRQVKSPKIYFRDSGIMHMLLGIQTPEMLYDHVRLGASWEGFALEEIIQKMNVDSEDCYFWATHAGAEIDLLIFKNGKRLGFEIKYTSHPKITKSIKAAQENLKLDHVYIVIPHRENFKLAENIEVIGLENF